MLEEVLKYINNWFVTKDGIHRGTFEISSGSLNVDFIKNNQYFRIIGSIFNDGVYKYPRHFSVDEEFDGEIWALAIPKVVLDIIDEIDDWVEKYDEVVSSPYQSESYGGYSYSKSSNGGVQGGDNSPSWQSVFGKKLNMWRKI